MRNVKQWLRLLAAMACLAWIEAGSAANTSFLDDSVLAEFKDADVTMFQSAIDEALTLAAGEAKAWENPATGAGGRITALGAHSHDGRECRKLRVENHARGRTGKGDWNYCRSAEGRWELTIK